MNGYHRKKHQAQVTLEHVASAGVDTLQRLSKNAHLAFARLQKPCGHIEQGALAAASGADDADKLTFCHGQ